MAIVHLKALSLAFKVYATLANYCKNVSRMSDGLSACRSEQKQMQRKQRATLLGTLASGFQYLHTQNHGKKAAAGKRQNASEVASFRAERWLCAPHQIQTKFSAGLPCLQIYFILEQLERGLFRRKPY
jgi:hypothetical protein